MTLIKICGVTLADDAARVAAAGADFIGLNFWPRSKRYLDPARAPLIAAAARAAGPIKIVGVFVEVDPDELRAIMALVDLDVIQLHGDESDDEIRRVRATARAPIWKALAVAAAADLEAIASLAVEAILLDTPTPGRGGSGQTFDWSLARAARIAHPDRDFVLAGGLRPDNVAAAIRAVAPWAVDVASGIEAAPGVKDPHKLAAFIAAARSAR